MPHEGAVVSYVGDPSPDRPAIGDLGLVIDADRGSAHVMWRSGVRLGRVDLIGDDDLATQASSRLTGEDEFTVSARSVVDVGGAEALVAALAEDGYFAGLTMAADDAIEAIAVRVRQDPYLASVLADLDQDEVGAFTSLTVAAVLRERLAG